MSKTRATSTTPPTPPTSEKSQIIDFTQIREQRLEEKRRHNERVFFKQLLGIYSVVTQGSGTETMKKIDIMDVSEEGLSFQVPFNPDEAWPAETKNLTIRLYFSQDTYLPLHLKIQNSRAGIDRGVRVTRYGCIVDPTTTTYETYRQFVRFLKMYSEHSHGDRGDVTVFYF